MELETIKTELRNHIREKYRVAPEDQDFNDTVNLYDYGYVDSFGAVQLKMFVESKFAIEFTPTDLTNVSLNSIDQMADFVVKRKKGQA